MLALNAIKTTMRKSVRFLHSRAKKKVEEFFNHILTNRIMCFFFRLRLSSTIVALFQHRRIVILTFKFFNLISRDVCLHIKQKFPVPSKTFIWKLIRCVKRVDYTVCIDGDTKNENIKGSTIVSGFPAGMCKR